MSSTDGVATEEVVPGGPPDRSESTTDRQGYDAQASQERWVRYWREDETFRTREDSGKQRRYVLDMFPYPSGDLHMGHAEAFAMGDVIARYLRLRGYEVLHPIGWDSFGLPAENAAIKNNAHPAEWTYANIDTQATSFQRYGLSLDWSRRLHTSDPEYYRWTQWLFLRFFERGLAYRKASPVNWCPADQTVLANEQVIDGHCERCGSPVTRRELTQWYFKITDYVEDLLAGLDELSGRWPERVLTMQRNWIGKSIGAWVEFTVLDEPEPITTEPIRVFTTRPDTLYGATFLVLAPDSAMTAELVTDDHRDEFQAYLEKTRQASEIERQAADREKTGVFTGRYAVNPATGEQIPIWVADYVLADYGSGAVMAVPAHDQRDLEFANRFDLPVRMVVDTGEPDPATSSVATTGDGSYVNSGPLDGLSDKESGIARIIEQLGADGHGEPATTYRLRDWLLSRQRFWGAPIPIVHCPEHGEVPVPDDQLPVELPDLRGADLVARGEENLGQGPLAGAADWVHTTCPICGGPAKRDTDTMDTFVDSSWYFFRYTSPGYTDGPFDPEAVRRWMPVFHYVGGVEHAILHLLYMRFFTRVLHDMGMIDFAEPMQRLLNQGQVINQGKSMSKSLGNGVDLGEQIDRFGVDAVRLTVVFAGPPEDDIDWAALSPAGSLRFLQRAYRLAADITSEPGVDLVRGDQVFRRTTHQTIAAVTELLDDHKFNVAVARVMELVNATRKRLDANGADDPAVREAVETITIMLSLVAPFVAEDMWALLGHQPSVANSTWPSADPALLVQESVTCVVQIKGKVRAKLEVSPDIGEGELEALALADPGVQRALGGQSVAKVIIRAPKLVSIVPG